MAKGWKSNSHYPWAKYLVFKVNLQFLGASFATLAKNMLKTGFHSIKHLSKKFLGPEAGEYRLLVRTGVYPYEYVDCWEKMDEKQLPLKEAFYSKLTDSNIRDEDYEHGQNLWRTLNLRTMRDYHNLYMMSMLHTFRTPILMTRHDTNNITIHRMHFG